MTPYPIADLGCRTYLSVDYTIIEDLVEFLNREMPLIFLDTDAWEDGELGELTTISMHDAFESINLEEMV